MSVSPTSWLPTLQSLQQPWRSSGPLKILLEISGVGEGRRPHLLTPPPELSDWLGLWSCSPSWLTPCSGGSQAPCPQLTVWEKCGCACQ